MCTDSDVRDGSTFHSFEWQFGTYVPLVSQLTDTDNFGFIKVKTETVF